MQRAVAVCMKIGDERAGRRRYRDAGQAARQPGAPSIPREGADMSKRVFVTAMLGMLVAAGSAYAAGDAAAGKEVFKKCALCHTTEAGKNKIGPSLAGVMD